MQRTFNRPINRARKSWRSAITTLILGIIFNGIPAGSESVRWSKVDEGQIGERNGPALLPAGDLGKMLLVGAAKGASFVQAFDLAARSWRDFATNAPGKEVLQNGYQTVYNPATRTVYCLAGGPVLYSFDTVERTWKTHAAASELEGLSWPALACDPAGGRLVAIGADKKADNLGWLRTVIYDIPVGKWTCLEVAKPDIVVEHKALVAALEAVNDLVGHTRLAWYREAPGSAANASSAEGERTALGGRCAALKKLPRMDKYAAELEGIARLIRDQQLFEALKAARVLQRRFEAAVEEQYPVPLSRRNSPLVFDERNKVFVLFGGDHEDYLLNDTWRLDVDRKAWKRGRPSKAPSPRAGHALCYLPKSGRVACYEGYLQSSSTDYGAIPYSPINPLQLWLYDAKADRWDLAGSWPLPGPADGNPAPAGYFYGYSAQYFSPPALAADAQDNLVLAGTQTTGLWFWKWKRPCETWSLLVTGENPDTVGAEKLGTAPNLRLYRKGAFLADYCETPESPTNVGLDKLPENQWVKLPPPPRNPCRGCRQRDWGTSVWDSDRDQILLWGGGHCVRAASTVAHYSPASGRLVEGYDADEPYGANGSGGYDSSLLNRPWVSVHNYNHYAYDPKCKMLVSGRGYLYDPGRMDWLRREPIALPYAFAWGSTCVETSPHGVVAWARKKASEDFGLWLFDRDEGWVDLQPKGKLFGPYCDSHGMVYDARRDRMIFSGVGGAYQKPGNGSFLTFDFKTRAVETLTPEHAELNRTGNARELAYLDHADWILIGELYGEDKAKRRYTRVYDCARNRMALLDAGIVPDGHGSGWMYDARRKLAYVFTIGGEAWAMRANPQTAKLLDQAGR